MVNTLDITNARLPGNAQLQRICVDAGKISAIAPMDTDFKDPSLHAEQLDIGGDWISLGGIDLQINGGLGLAFPDFDVSHVSKLAEICQLLWQQGVDGFLPTLVTTSRENIRRSLALFAKFQSQIAESAVPSAQVLGVHLEGPFLNPEKRGAHPAQYLLPLTVEQVRYVLGDHAYAVKLITLAPELDPIGAVIPYLRSLGIIVSLGHSLATAVQAQAAFDQGATRFTGSRPGQCRCVLWLYCRWSACSSHHARIAAESGSQPISSQRCSRASGFARWGLSLGYPSNPRYSRHSSVRGWHAGRDNGAPAGRSPKFGQVESLYGRGGDRSGDRCSASGDRSTRIAAWSTCSFSPLAARFN
jgi:hypothetical protein